MAAILLISLSLAMDAFSVSVTGGIKSQGAKMAQAIKVAAFFGVFQAFMPVLGWLIGEAMKGYIAGIDHWIAFILLGGIGLKMIQEARSKSPDKKDILNIKTLLLLAIATSIDALIIGITLNLLNIPFLVSIATIGITTFILCFFGFLFGKKLGGLFGRKIEILGGLVLIFLGFKILAEHLIS